MQQYKMKHISIYLIIEIVECDLILGQEIMETLW